jgi:PTH2 family peptidyl-tRNA hydrolase
MQEVKQYIIVRRDLGMNAGKLAAQAGHAVMKVFFDKMSFSPCTGCSPPGEPSAGTYSFEATHEEKQWIDGKFTKITKGVKSEAKLMDVYNKAKEAGLNVSLIKDAGLYGLDGENYTVVAVGPNYVDKCEPVVGKLRLLTDL